MKAMVYRESGGPEVIRAEEMPIPEPGPGELLVRVAYSGVNPTDWKSRTGTTRPAGAPDWQIPDQDGAGLVVGVGNGVDPVLLHERVWLYEAAYQRSWGTAAEYTLVPLRNAVLLGTAPYTVGAALGVPFLTAHRCLTLAESMPDRLGEGALTGKVVLVQGGAGAVGNAAIQLAHWSDATVIATVSGPEKAQLAAGAGADHVINYRTQDVVAEVRKIAPRGVDTVVEVAVAQNAGVDAQLVGMHGAVASYAADPDQSVTLPIRSAMQTNAQWHFVLLYTEPARAKGYAIEDVNAAVVDDAVRAGHDAGLPLSFYPLDDTAGAHAAVEAGAVGKVLITVDADPPARVG